MGKKRKLTVEEQAERNRVAELRKDIDNGLKFNDPVSDNYGRSFSNLDIDVRNTNFNKSDSIALTPLLDRVNKYIGDNGYQNMSDQQKKNIRALNDGINSYAKEVDTYHSMGAVQLAKMAPIHKDVSELSNKDVGLVTNLDFNDIGVTDIARIALKSDYSLGRLNKMRKRINNMSGRFYNVYKMFKEKPIEYKYGGNLFEDGDELTKGDNYVSENYSRRYPNIVKKIGGLSSFKRDDSYYDNDIDFAIDDFTKADSAQYTPVLDRVEKYLSKNDIKTEQEKKNAKAAGYAILGMSAYNDSDPEKSGVKLINKNVPKVSDAFLKYIMNKDLSKIGLGDGLKLIGKSGLPLLEIPKIAKYVSSRKSEDDYAGPRELMWYGHDEGEFRHGGKMRNLYSGSNGITEFNVGGTHEENPYGGIPQGMGANGLPNLVEEGELKWNDFIFSKKMRMRDAESYGLQKSFNDMPFADIARKYSKESEDRPNDIISKRGLDVQLGILSAIQEKEKERKEIAQMKRQAKAQRFDMGGQVVIPEYQMPPGINSVQAAQTNPLRSGGWLPVQRNNMITTANIMRKGGGLNNQQPAIPDYVQTEEMKELYLKNPQVFYKYRDFITRKGKYGKKENDKVDRPTVDEHLQMAYRTSKQTGVPMNIILVQGAGESNFGLAPRANRTKNVFNYGNDDAGNDHMFDSWEKGYNTYANLLKRSYPIDQVQYWLDNNSIRKDKRGYYATHPDWGNQIARMLNELGGDDSGNPYEVPDAGWYAGRGRYGTDGKSIDYNDPNMSDNYNDDRDAVIIRKGEGVRVNDTNKVTIPSFATSNRKDFGGNLFRWNGQMYYDDDEENDGSYGELPPVTVTAPHVKSWMPESERARMESEELRRQNQRRSSLIPRSLNRLSPGYLPPASTISSGSPNFVPYPETDDRTPWHVPDSTVHEGLYTPYALPGTTAGTPQTTSPGNSYFPSYSTAEGENVGPYFYQPPVTQPVTQSQGPVVAQSTGQPVTQNAVTGNAVQQTTQVPVGGTTETVSEERPAALSTVKSKDFDSLGYFKQKAEDEKAKLRERTFAKIKADSLDSNAYNGLGLIQDDSENYNYSMPNQGWNNALRYAPVIANLGLLAYNIFDKPEQFKYNRVGASTITQRMAYNPIDSEYIANQIRQQAAGTNRALIDNSGGNRGIATSLIMAANRQSQNAIGDALMKGTIMNRELEEKAKAFNRQTDTTNAQLSLDAQKTNAQIDMQEQQANAASRAAKRNAINQGIVNLGNALGKIGTENRWGDLAPAMTGYDQYAKYQKAQSEINAAKQRKEAETKAKKEAIKFEKEKLKKAADDKKAIEKRKKAAEAKKKADEDAKSKVRYFDTNTKTWRYR